MRDKSNIVLLQRNEHLEVIVCSGFHEVKLKEPKTTQCSLSLVTRDLEPAVRSSCLLLRVNMHTVATLFCLNEHVGGLAQLVYINLVW